MDLFFTFFSFEDPNVRSVVLGGIMISIASSLIGTFMFLKKKSLVGDAVSHSVLPGVCIGFLIAGDKNPLLLTIGAFATGWLALVAIDWLEQNSKLKKDTTLGLVLSVFFALGIVLLTYIQHSGNDKQAGLDHFLFGKIAALVQSDFIIFASMALLIILIIFALYKEFKLLTFDPIFARAIGLPYRSLELVLTSLTVLTIITGIQAIGIVLMAAMLITPVVAANFWSYRLSYVLLLSSVFAALGSVGGAYFSFVFPSVPTGPMIIIIISIITFLSILLAPKKGLIANLYRTYKNQQKVKYENILKTVYRLGEQRNDWEATFGNSDILKVRFFETKELNSTLQKLCRWGYLQNQKNDYSLTKEGFQEGKRITKLHRLWELYLSEYLNLNSDHIHDNAESMEHIITPKIEAALEKNLKFPKTDPHKSKIPY